MARKVSLGCGVILALFVFLPGCAVLQPAQAEEEQDQPADQWQGKGYGFTWEMPTPEGLQFSGVVHGCAVEEFVARVQVDGPTGDGHHVSMAGSAVMEGLPLAEPGKMIHYYTVEIPMTGALDYQDADCRVKSTLRLLAKVDFESRLATLQEARSLEGKVTCTRGGISVTSPQPGLSDLPTPENLPVQILDASECQQMLEDETPPD